MVSLNTEENNMSAKLVVRNEAQKILFEKELAGQISDGYWENSRPWNHWRWVGRELVVEVGENVGVYGGGPVRSYNFNNKMLVEIVGERMIEYVREYDNNYDMKALRKDLKDLSNIVNGRAK
jgi:hypothetical protein